MSTPLFARRPLFLAVAAALSLAACGGGGGGDSVPAMPAAPVGLGSVDTAPVPSVTAFVDTYQTNLTANTTVSNNAVLRLLSDFSTLWTPGASWNDGTATALGAPILSNNIQQVKTLAGTRTAADETNAYLIDRRNQNYSALNGLGPLRDVFATASGAATTIAGVAADATSVKYDDTGNGAGSSTSALGNVVTLIGTLRGSYSSTNPAKAYYQYMRPFRWLNDTSVVIPTLRPAISATPASDGGFPSGHTNAGYLASYALAYAVPQRYQELLANASDIGQSRIVAGMHSPGDVIGGRVVATALAAAILNDSANAAVKASAYSQAQSYLQTATSSDANTLYTFAHSGSASSDAQFDATANRASFLTRMTYGFPAIGATTTAAPVPKGAEVLLETRLPYLDAAQRRVVLKTTAIASGSPILGDAEGWGRLNPVAAADGFGAFNGDVTVAMDASKNGFNASDIWRNNISGAGKLTKQGTGALTLVGTNAYTGGTELQAGQLNAASATALGKGDMYVSGGTLVTSAAVKVAVGGQFTLRDAGALTVTLASADAGLAVQGNAFVNGALKVNFAKGYQPTAGTELTILSAARVVNRFTSVAVGGSVPATVAYRDGAVVLRFGS